MKAMSKLVRTVNWCGTYDHLIWNRKYVDCKCRFQFCICFLKNLFPLCKQHPPSPPIFCWLFPCTLHYCRKTLYIETLLFEHDLEIWHTRVVAMLSLTAQEQRRSWPRWENEGSTVARTYCSVSVGPTTAPCLMPLVILFRIPGSSSAVSNTSSMIIRHDSHWSFVVL
jgi:hypothetical protein